MAKKKYVKAECNYCDGSGIVDCDCNGGIEGTGNDDCPACGGSEKHMCPLCDGKGYELQDEEGNVI